MAHRQDRGILGFIRKLAQAGDTARQTDGQLLERFLKQREESAFEALVRRHGPMVMGVCRRILRNEHDAEDAFQATFLVFVRKADTVLPREALANWLYGVAYRTALGARTAAARRRAKESTMPKREPLEEDVYEELRPLLDRELNRLPDKYRLPIVLCDLEGESRKSAAQRLGWREGTLSGRLARARAMLASRLARHGLHLSGAVVAAAISQSTTTAAVPETLLRDTTRIAMLLTRSWKASTGVISSKVASLTEGVLQTMLIRKLKIMAILVLSLTTAGGMAQWCIRSVLAQEASPPIPALAFRDPGSRPASPKAAQAPAGPRERDSWLAFVGGDKRCGFVHTRVTRLENGQFRYVVEERILIDILGVGKEEITSRREYVVTSAYRLVSLQSEGRQASGVTRARGTVRDGKLEVTALRAGMERTQKVELPNGVIFDHCLEDWLRDRPKDFQAGKVLLLDEVLWDIRPAAVKRRDTGQAERIWEVDRGPGDGTVTYVYSADGTLREIKGPLAPHFLKRCSAEEAKSISYYKMVGRDLLDFPLDKEIGRVDQLTEMTIRLSWAGIPFDRFQLEDERQHVVQRSEKDGCFQAVVRIGRQKAVSDSLPLPVRDPKFAPYLAETRFIKPRDPKLAETARRIVPTKASTLEAARALSAWVATTVKPELIAETLTGPEVLDCKRGKCSEYAILFASMARSIGLPTRMVLGQRLVGGRWAGHMWNEVFVGRWLTVDASVNEVGNAPALLKLTHSDTVAGTQPLRRDLTQSLSVSVEDFKSQANRLKGKFTTGIDKGVYTNAAFGCRVSVPVQEWSMEDQSKPGVAVVRFRVPKQDDVQIHFAAFELPVPLKAVTDARIKIYKDYKLVKDEEHKVGALKGRLLRFERSKDGKKLILTEILWAKDSTGFIVNMLAEAAAHDKHEANFRKIVSSFEQLPSEK